MIGPGDDGDYGKHIFSMPPTALSVSDIERLAKAGVQISMGPVHPQSDMSYPTPPPAPSTEMALEEAIWQRWQRNFNARSKSPFRFPAEGELRPYRLLATEVGDKVFVSVHPYDSAPFLLQDDTFIFPSDALMASLALYEQTKDRK
jgi:hypothetical protein